MRELAEKKFVEEMRSMTTERQYFELTRYGKIKADVSGSGYSGEYRIMVFEYLGTRWFMHLQNGDIQIIKEV